MSKELAQNQDVVSLMASKFRLGPKTFMTTLKSTVMKPGKDGRIATDAEVASFLLVANKYDLNPFTKEIYAFPDKRAGIIPIVGVDGFITIMNRHPQFDGYEFNYSDEDIIINRSRSCPKWAEVRIHRKDRSHPTVVREYLDEVYQEARGGYSGPWQTHTKRMLRHKTLIQGARVAFGVSGVYDEDEAVRIIDARAVAEDVNMKPEVEMPKAISEETPAKTAWEEEEPTTPPKQQTEQPVNIVSEAQAKRLYAIAKENGYSDDDIKAYIGAHYHYTSTRDISRDHYEEIVDHFQIQKGA